MRQILDCFMVLEKMIKKGFRLGDENFRNKINRISYIVKNELAKTKILIYKNEFVLNLRYKIKVFSRGFYLNGLNSLE